jgi:hypothetical protein
MMRRSLLFMFLLSACRFFGQDYSISGIDGQVERIRTREDQLSLTEEQVSDSSTRHFFFEEEELRLFRSLEQGRISKQETWYFFEGRLLYTEIAWLDQAGRSLYLEKTYHGPAGMVAWLNTDNSFVGSHTSEYARRERELKAAVREILGESRK